MTSEVDLVREDRERLAKEVWFQDMTKTEKPKYVEVDIVALMNLKRLRGSKFLLDRKRMKRLLEEGAKRMTSEVDLVRED
ncbi:unnamed protein product [Heligmosomoides polygyrus]|uniref:Reverse transcriptase domain-containing protein n=1 Tax=Heligmosomoides polygyrus TaxID=6339 RepID=A0A183FCS0_HELPZ|nr:unnamed protein product [Heligmosomoides polygyrus]